MPELPEVECTRRSLEPHVLGRQIIGLKRGSHRVVAGLDSDQALLLGRPVAAIDRLGKEMAVLSDPGCDEAADNQPRGMPEPHSDERSNASGCFVVHLGMTGSLQHHAPQAVTELDATADPHLHLQWLLDDGSRLVFRDPRRFGGVWTYPSQTALCEGRWSQRGPDALKATPADLHHRLLRTRRAVKAALLDQAVVAGLGNIYVDELLFGARVHPLTPACDIDRTTAASLARRMRSLLLRAIEAGGSTLRDYVDGLGQSGGYQHAHRVYGRSGLPCRRCRTPLTPLVVAGRSTVCCEACQPLRSS